MDYDLLSDSNIYKNTYKQLTIWVKELMRLLDEQRKEIRQNKFLVERATRLESLNYQQAALIMELEFRNRMMMEKELGVAEDDVVDLAEFRRSRLRAVAKTILGGGPPDGEWLSKMKVGTEFLVRPKAQKTWMLAKFMQAGSKNGNVLVIPMKGEEVNAPESEWMWVDPEEFCKFWELRGILLIPKEEENDGD